MAELTAYEQLLLELVNRARLDPNGEAARYGIALNQGLAAGTLTGAAKQVLAPNELLVDAARDHSQWMIDTDIFSHTGVGGSSPGDRMEAAGYEFTGSWTWGENIAWSGTTGTPNLLTYTQDLHRNLFLSAGHRVNILEGNFRELGTGIVQGPFTVNGTTYNAVMATENFATSGPNVFVTGVAYNDLNRDAFYSIGEAVSGVTVTVTSGATFLGSDVTATAGGYAVGVANTSAKVTFSGGDLAAPVVATISGGGLNAKVDLVNGNTIYSSATTVLGEGAAHLKLLGIANLSGTGNSGANALTGNSGNNTLTGLAGSDTISGGAGNDVIIGGAGADRLSGGLGRDRFDYNSTNESFGGSATRDVIRDWDTGGVADVIDLSTIDARAGAGGANDAFVFLAARGAAFTGAGQIRWGWVDRAGTADDRTYIYINTDANRSTAEMVIEIVGLKTITAADFIL
jgi:Ca2+-binding RTX toxin-like protein